MRIRLTRKLADALNGVDLRAMTVGDVVDLDLWSADMLVAEAWAEYFIPSLDNRATADESGPRRNRPTTRQRLNKLLAEGPRRPSKTRK